jgi:leucyl-tRNA synthetase
MALFLTKSVKYDFKKVEKKWQKIWEDSGIYRAKDFSKKPKYYPLVEFPYPSGDGLHVGHIRSYTAMDIIARKRRMEGRNVLYPMGWDAFGLPTENYAIKTGVHPAKVTKKNTDNFRKQLKSLGFSFDWSREVNTSDPAYYKWTQWIFLQLFKSGLAYKAKMPINWCPSCKIGLANEEVVAGRCERCGTVVEQKQKEQWMLKITAYADKLLKGLKKVDFLPEIKRQQENWIGRSEGALLKFKVESSKLKGETIEVFTTRPDTLFGATYVVVAPEHPLIKNLESGIENYGEVKNYAQEAKRKTEIERTAEDKEKTGVELKGVKAVNPANGEEIPVWVADYVLGGYGTGAIMAVPAHDERDFEFATRHHLPVREAVAPRTDADYHADLRGCYTGEGTLVNSGTFTGMPSEKAKWEITKFVGGVRKVQYKLRDWVFSRQRYWGEPIPLVFCEHCAERIKNKELGIKETTAQSELENPGWIAVPEKDLPIKLPAVKNFKPRDDGESPLASVSEWISVKCPKCKGAAKRETDVMPNWAGSSWYFLRYTDPKNKKTFADLKKLKYWMAPALRSSKSEGGVDWYNGGMEHVTLHLLYSRFWNQFLHDKKFVPVAEPYHKRTAHGMILGEGGVKMSKSKGNIVNPNTIIKEFGADVLRMYEMFMGPFDQAIAWDPKSIVGMERFLKRVWQFYHERGKGKGESQKEKGEGRKLKELERAAHQTIKKVTEDIERMQFHTAISQLMIFLSRMEEAQPPTSHVSRSAFLKLLAPFAPHMAEEIWLRRELTQKTRRSARKPIRVNQRSNPRQSAFKSVHMEPWPSYNPRLVKEERFTLIIQVNGKVRDTVEAPVSMTEEEARNLTLARPKIRSLVGNTAPRRVVYIPGRLINIVLQP